MRDNQEVEISGGKTIHGNTFEGLEQSASESDIRDNNAEVVDQVQEVQALSLGNKVHRVQSVKDQVNGCDSLVSQRSVRDVDPLDDPAVDVHAVVRLVTLGAGDRKHGGQMQAGLAGEEVW